MPKILLGIGSNINREENIRSGMDVLPRFVGDMKISPVYESPAYGFSGENFYNLAVSGDTEHPLDELIHLLREVEFAHGREKQTSKFSSRQLDIDILMYGSKVGEFYGVTLPRVEILSRAYVLKPMSDIEPDYLYPQSDKCLRDLWLEFNGDKRQLWQSEFQCVSP